MWRVFLLPLDILSAEDDRISTVHYHGIACNGLFRHLREVCDMLTAKVGL